MPRPSESRPSLACVPVSTTGIHDSKRENRVTAIGRNKAHEMRCIRDLVELYGWSYCEDGNLYKGSYVA
jgi:hypothetical protein